MYRVPLRYFLLLLAVCVGMIFSAPHSALAQGPTPTADPGMYITVISTEPHINVRMGPSSMIYPVVGTLPTGSTAPALGRSPGGDWVQISFPGAPYDAGWVYAPLVQVSPGVLHVVEPPPTPAQPATATIDPTLQAQYVMIPTATILPTFTPPPALTIPAFTEIPPTESLLPIPAAPLIVGFGIIGAVGFLFSLRRRF